LRCDLLAQISGIDSAHAQLRSTVLRGLVQENDKQFRQEIVEILMEQADSFNDITGLLSEVDPIVWTKKRLSLDREAG